MRSVTSYKLKKIQKRQKLVAKSQAIAKIEKQALLKVKTQLKQLEEMAFKMSNPVTRLTKSPSLMETRSFEKQRDKFVEIINESSSDV